MLSFNCFVRDLLALSCRRFHVLSKIRSQSHSMGPRLIINAFFLSCADPPAARAFSHFKSEITLRPRRKYTRYWNNFACSSFREVILSCEKICNNSVVTDVCCVLIPNLPFYLLPPHYHISGLGHMDPKALCIDIKCLCTKSKRLSWLKFSYSAPWRPSVMVRFRKVKNQVLLA